MNKKSVLIILICLLGLGILYFLGKELYTMHYNRNNYAVDMWKQLNPKVVHISDLQNEQIVDSYPYLVVGDMEDLKTSALSLQLISDESNYTGGINALLLTCNNDLFGREYCHIVSGFNLKSQYLKPVEENEVLNSIECILIDPYEQHNGDENCYTVRKNEYYGKNSQINVPTLWSQGNNPWRLLLRKENNGLNLSLKKI